MSAHKPHQSQSNTHEHGPYATDHAGHADHLVDGAVNVPAKKPEAHSADHDLGPVKTSAGSTVRPLHDRVIIERMKDATTSKGGIIIPDTAKEKPMEGKVIAVGNGKVFPDGSVRKIGVSVGDHVLFGKYGGTEVKVDGADRLVVREEDIFAVLLP